MFAAALPVAVATVANAVMATVVVLTAEALVVLTVSVVHSDHQSNGRRWRLSSS